MIARIRPFPALFAAAAAFLGAVPAAPAAPAVPDRAAVPADGEAMVARLRAERDAGAIDDETYLLQTFRYVFARERTDPRHAPADATPLKCFTDQVAELERLRDSLSAAAVEEMDGYLAAARSFSPFRATYVSPSGRFELTYSTTGTDAVPSTDTTPANGIPDYIERAGEYLDESWDTEITTLGFTAPTLPGDGTYDIAFANIGAYGFTSVSFPTTDITIENDFLGFPTNQDPDGKQLGALKVTCAHEFKHASQYTNNGWSEGGWVELDATWVEDIVFDVTNDYYNYINFNSSNSQLSDPWLRLDNGGTGSYEDCLWQHYLSEKHGNQFIVDLWDRRATNPGENMKNSYQSTLQLYGSSWGEAWPEMYEWCWFTGSRAEPPYGFGEAAGYLRMNLWDGPITAYPYADADSVDQIACRPYRFNAGTAGQFPVIAFNGDDAHCCFQVSVIIESSTTFTIEKMTLDANNDGTYTPSLPFGNYQYVGVLVTNTQRSGGNKAYTLDVTEVSGPVGVAVSPGGTESRLAMHPAAPNPFAAATRIAWSAPRDTRATVRILDVAGRTVRVLHDGPVAAGEGRVDWDGRSSAGRPVPAGVYWSRIETPEGSVARKVIAVR
jgi:hypothetical protein